MFGKVIRIGVLSILCLVAAATGSQSAMAQMYTPGGEGAPGDEIFKACGFCHGAQGQGRQRLDAPPIAGLPAWYVERQMLNFVSEIRGYHPDDLPRTPDDTYCANVPQ